MKKFSQLAFPYIVWAVLMLVFPMVLIALYSVTDQGNTILSFTFTLEHYAKFFTDPDFLLILCDCGKDNSDLPVTGLSDRILYCAQ